MFDMVVENLPNASTNITFMMPDLAGDRLPTAPNPGAAPTSPYPNIELSILNSQRQAVATTFIVEHKEEHTTLTLHLRVPDFQEHYIARAEMTYEDQTLQVVEIPFTLNQGDPTHE
jgi:hypothetical protein